MSDIYSEIRFTRSVASIVKNQLSDVRALIARSVDVDASLIERAVDQQLQLHPFTNPVPAAVRALALEFIVRVVLFDELDVVLSNPDGDRVTNINHARASALPGGKTTVTGARA